MPLPNAPRGGENKARRPQPTPPERPIRRPAPREEASLPPMQDITLPKAPRRPAPAPLPEEDNPFTPIEAEEDYGYDFEDDEEEVVSAPPQRPQRPQKPVRPTRAAAPEPEPEPAEDIDALFRAEAPEEEDAEAEQDAFTQETPASKIVLEKDEEEPEATLEKTKPEKPKKAGGATKSRLGRREKKNEDSAIPAYFTSDTSIDEKNKQLEPYGRVKRKAKVGEFDHRKNIRQRAALVRAVVIGLLALLVGAGLKNALLPPASLSEEEVVSIVNTTINDTGFPTSRGEGFALAFMQAYMNVNQSPASNQLFSYYYSGSLSGGSGDLNQSASNDFKQKVVYGPIVYSAKSPSSKTGTYVIGALVQPELPGGVAAASSTTGEESTAQWSFFSVNVYYDEKTDTFRIAPDSPTVVPPVQVAGNLRMPNSKPLGNGSTSDELNDAVKSVVEGYLKGYAMSSLEDHSAVDQYVTDPKDTSLVVGLNKRYTLTGSTSEAITYETYLTDDPNILKVHTKVKWADTIAPRVSATYDSEYVITLSKQGSKYLVSKFAPKGYVPVADK